MALIGVLLGITMCAMALAIRYIYIRQRGFLSLERDAAAQQEVIVALNAAVTSIKSGMGELESKTAALAEDAKVKAPKHIRMRAWNEDAVIPEVTK